MASGRRCCRASGTGAVRGLVLDAPFLPAIQGAASKPLAFTVLDIANRLTAGGATIARQVAE